MRRSYNFYGSYLLAPKQQIGSDIRTPGHMRLLQKAAAEGVIRGHNRKDYERRLPGSASPYGYFRQPVL